MGETGPYRAEFGAIHHEDAPGFLFTVDPPQFAADVARALNAAEEEAFGVPQEIAAERRRQVEAEGWTPEHDDEHSDGSLARAAAAYAIFAAGDVTYTVSRGIMHAHRHGRPASVASLVWPWARKWWKPKNRRRDLVRAAALLVAEIERLDRQALSALGGDHAG